MIYNVTKNLPGFTATSTLNLKIEFYDSASYEVSVGIVPQQYCQRGCGDPAGSKCISCRQNCYNGYKNCTPKGSPDCKEDLQRCVYRCCYGVDP